MKMTVLPDKEYNRKRRVERKQKRSLTKRKHRQARTRRYLKRKKLSGLLLWNLSICVVLSQIMLWSGIYFYERQNRAEVEASMEESRDMLIENIKKDYRYTKEHFSEMTERETQFARLSKIAISSYAECNGVSNGASALFETDSGRKIADSSNCDYLMLDDLTEFWETDPKDRDSEAQRYRYVYVAAEPIDESIIKAVETCSEYENYGDTPDDHEERFLDKCTEYYLKGDTFYLGKAVISTRKNDIIVDQQVFPAQLKVDVQGMQAVHALEGEHKYYLLWHFGHNSTELMNLVEGEYQSNIEQKQPVIGASEHEQTEGLFRMTRTDYDRIQLEDDVEVALVLAYRYNFFSIFGKKVISYVLLTILAALVLGFGLAKYRFARLKARYDLEDYQRSLTNAMAHDLKSPLMIISGMAENLRDNIHSEKREYYAKQIGIQVQDMNRMIEQLLLYAKLDQTSIQIEKQAVDIAAIAKKLTEKYDVLCEERGMIMEVSGSLTISGNEGLLTHMMDNLLQNAVLHGKTGSTILVSCSEKGVVVENEITNELSDEELGKLTEPFEKRADRSRTGGHGLGLAIVDRIAVMHGMKLSLEIEDVVFCASISVAE